MSSVCCFIALLSACIFVYSSAVQPASTEEVMEFTKVFEESEGDVWTNKDWAGVASYYTDDAIFSLVGKTLHGRREIQDFFSSHPTIHDWSEGEETVVHRMEVFDDLAIVYASFNYSHRLHGRKHVPILEVWRKIDGHWLTKYDFENDVVNLNRAIPATNQPPLQTKNNLQNSNIASNDAAAVPLNTQANVIAPGATTENTIPLSQNVFLSSANAGTVPANVGTAPANVEMPTTVQQQLPLNNVFVSSSNNPQPFTADLFRPRAVQVVPPPQTANAQKRHKRYYETSSRQQE